MSPVKRPSSVTGLRKGMATPVSEKRVSEMTDAEVQSLTAPPRPEKPVRFTLDLDRDRHRFLKEKALEIEARQSEIVRELLDEMRNDQDLWARVRARIWQTRQK